jgi:hypothetical protein
MSDKRGRNVGPWESDDELEWTDGREVFYPNLPKLWWGLQPPTRYSDGGDWFDEMRLRQEGPEHNSLMLRHYQVRWQNDVIESVRPLSGLWRHLQQRLM